MIYITDDELGGGVGHSISEVFVTESRPPTVGKFYVTGKEPANLIHFGYLGTQFMIIPIE